MKPYLESVRRMSRVGLVLFALSVVASAVIAIQYCTQEYISNLPGMRQMFAPLIVFTYLGGIALALDGFSFLNKRADSDYYHGLPISRRHLFWAITLAGLTWIAATVLASVIVTTVVFTMTKVSFVALYPLVAVPFYIVATMLVFAAASIAASLTGTLMTDIGLALIMLGLIRFVQFVVARGIIANAQIIGWLDLPWFLSPVTNVATGQIAMLVRHMLEYRLYDFGNIGYSALLAGLELVVACMLFMRRPSEIAEHGAKDEHTQTIYACLAVLPVAILIASGALVAKVTNILMLLAVSIGIYVIYQFVVLRAPKKVLRSMPWLLIPLLLATFGFFGTKSAAIAMETEVPNENNIAYVQFSGMYRGTDMMTYQQYKVSTVRFTEQKLIDYSLQSLRENIASIQSVGYVNYSYKPQQTYYSIMQPVTFVLKSGRRVGRLVTFENQNQLLALCEENPEFAEAVRSLPPENSVCYLQGYGTYNARYNDSRDIMRAFYDEVSSSEIIVNDNYRQTFTNVVYGTNEQQSIGSLTFAGYVGMTRYQDYYNIRLELPKTASAWMRWQNGHSTSEYLDLLEKILNRSEVFSGPTDYLDCTMTFYNTPMADGSKQTTSFYFSRYYQDGNDYNAAFTPLLKELSELLLRSTPTTDPNTLSVYVTWSGRALDENGAYIGADIMAQNAATGGNATASDGPVFYTSNGVAFMTGNSGSIVSYNPSYRAFSAEDQARVIEILQQWQDKQKSWSYANNNNVEPGSTIRGSAQVYATPTPEPPGISDVNPTATPKP